MEDEIKDGLLLSLLIITTFFNELGFLILLSRNGLF